MKPSAVIPLLLSLTACAAPSGLSPDEFQFSDPNAFKTEGGELVLYAASKYRPKVRSPLCIALLDGREFGSFVLDVEAMQTGKDVPHRDLCFFFGVESATRFYYVHIAKTADPHANNIFRVADAPRVALAEHTNTGNDWGVRKWHKIRIERDLARGTIFVYFDDMENPIMRGTDRTFGWGMIGVGSFDDLGRFKNIRIAGQVRPTNKRIFE